MRGHCRVKLVDEPDSIITGYASVAPVLDVRMRELCRRPYPNHPKGCPNWGKKVGCPPNCPCLSETLDLDYFVYAIYNVFNLEAHTRRMRQNHPEWSKRQVDCCLYWQPRARRQLGKAVAKFEELASNLILVHCPEAQGVNITNTLCQIGVHLEWPPEKYAVQVILVGTPKERKYV